MKRFLTRRRLLLAAVLLPAAAQLSASLARKHRNDLPPLDAQTAALSAEALHAAGTRMLLAGRTYEKAAARFALAIQKEPDNFAHQIALGCALAGRAASLSRAALFSHTLAKQQAEYPKKLQEWEAGRADGEAYNAQNPHAANGAVPPDSDAQPMATDEAAPDSLAFDPMAAPASRVDAVGTATPVEDFDALLARGLTDKAFEQLHAVVFKLVDTSFADRCAFALHSMQVFGALTNDFYTSLLYTSLGLPQTVFACGSPAQYAGLCHQPMQ